MTQLVRERVYKFLSIDNMQAYTESNSSGKILNCEFACTQFIAHYTHKLNSFSLFGNSPADNISGKSHYVKITAKAGEVFRLLAVFEDGAQDSKSYTSPKKDNLNSIGREKEKGRYVQLMSENRQVKKKSFTTSNMQLIIALNFSDYFCVAFYERKVLRNRSLQRTATVQQEQCHQSKTEAAERRLRTSNQQHH